MSWVCPRTRLLIDDEYQPALKRYTENIKRTVKIKWGNQNWNFIILKTIHYSGLIVEVLGGYTDHATRHQNRSGSSALNFKFVTWTIEYYYRGEASVQFNVTTVTTVNSSHTHFVSVLFSQCQQLAKLKQCKISGCFRFCLFLKPILNWFTHMTHQIEAQNLLYKIGIFL